MSENDFDQAHMAFMEQRLRELKAGARAAFHDLDPSYGIPNLDPDEVTPEQMQRVTEIVSAQIRQWGNADLADRFQAAYAGAHRALSEQARFLRLSIERALTDDEHAQAEHAAAVADEECEHLECVQAEASVYLAGLDEKGGA